MKKAIVLLSGGLDSATTLYYAKAKGYKCLCLGFDYGQRHVREIKSAQAIARRAGCRWQLLKINLPWKGSALLDKRMKVRTIVNSPWSMVHGIPNTYVPARNTIFLSFALSYAEAEGADAIFIGANAVDYSGYPDCRPRFIEAYNRVAAEGTKQSKIRIKAPLINKSKKEIVTLAARLRVPLELTWSCYKGASRPCGQCDSCVLRKKGFREAGITDKAWKAE
ncbi:MAG: 7-cyano-7-deazaguanine synthase QueC [Candidatus Omnitrophica bacterium]|nr:7-cyano-7-deazaguanine synthase QueC [Candidatus Omnitrophota bacterium]